MKLPPFRAAGESLLKPEVVRPKAFKPRRRRQPLEALSYRQAAEVLGIGRGKIPQLVKAKLLATVLILGKRRIPRAELDRVLDEGLELEAKQVVKPRRKTKKARLSPEAAIRALKIT